MKKIIYEIPIHVKALIKKIYYIFRLRPFLKEYGRKAYIIYPNNINKPETIRIKNYVMINSNAWIHSINSESCVYIGENTQIGHFFHCVCMDSVRVGNEVLIADRVFIADCTHVYDNINVSIINNGIKKLKIVEIGDGTWIGEGACILGAKIGKHSVIGANSVVTRDIPDYCVAAGVPAKIIKRFDSNNQKWVNC